MRKNLNTFLFFIILIFCGSFCKAQFAYIPDSAFRAFLSNNGYASAINGDSLDTTNLAVVSATDIFCSGMEIQSIEGIQYFHSLKNLDCSVNYLSSLPQLPVSLSSLTCFKNHLASLPNLTNLLNLYYIDCHNNLITSLPQLPPGLQVLNCDSNQLSVLPLLPPLLVYLTTKINNLHYLPALPGSLSALYCSENPLDSLPILPNSLLYLSCEGANLNYLPILPDSLDLLYAGGNHLTSLPSLPIKLRSLRCYYNNLASLPPLPPNLNFIDASFNNISVIDSFPNSLDGISIGGNLLDSLPNLPVNLSLLIAGMNHIHTFPVLPTTLKVLSINSNPIDSLPPLPFLTTLFCDDCNLTSLPSLPLTIRQLGCGNNQIHDLPPLYDSLEILNIDYTLIHCLPPVKFINQFSWDHSLITCLPNYLTIGATVFPALNLPLCQPTSGCELNWNISGNIYHDLNNNCLQDTLEQELKNIPVYLDSSGIVIQTSLSDVSGNYSFMASYGTYDVRINPLNIPIQFFCPASGTIPVQLTAVDSIADSLDFALSCPAVFDLFAAPATPETMFRPTRSVNVHLPAGDIFGGFGTSCYTGSGIVECIYSGPINYLSPANGAIAPTYIGTDTLRWIVNDFSIINPEKDFNIKVIVDSFAPITSQVCFDLRISPLTGDFFPLNNFSYSCFPVRNSIDPNEKYMSPSGLIDTAEHEFDFTVYFQNTGNAPAEDIYILDTIDSKLDAASFVFISSSHAVTTQIFPGNLLRFNFNNINLADSNSNETLSHGFVRFKLTRLPSIADGAEIKNTAYIYFDQNSALATNTVTANFKIYMEIGEVSNIKPLVVYPNPAENKVRIKYLSKGYGTIEIMDLIGEVVKTISIDDRFYPEIDLSQIQPGIYFIVLSDRAGRHTGKFVKE